MKTRIIIVLSISILGYKSFRALINQPQPSPFQLPLTHWHGMRYLKTDLASSTTYPWAIDFAFKLKWILN